MEDRFAVLAVLIRSWMVEMGQCAGTAFSVTVWCMLRWVDPGAV